MSARAPSRPAIVCAVDVSPRAHRVAAYAGALASRLDARVVLAHVFDPMMIPASPTRGLPELVDSEVIEAQERRRGWGLLTKAAEVLRGVEHAVVQPEGEARPGIRRLVREHDAHLLVVGSAARKPVERILQGSVSAETAEAASCPVAVVTDDAVLDHDGPVLVAFDGSEHSRRAARHGAGLAAALHQRLVLVHVVAPGEERVAADADLAGELHAACGRWLPGRAAADAPRLDIKITTEHGDPVEELSAAAGRLDASLVVLGSRGRNAVKAALLGSVSAGMVRIADRPLVIAGPHSEEGTASR